MNNTNTNTETNNGIKYTKPEVVLLQETGIGVAEIAARTCYDSFNASENDCIETFNNIPNEVKQDHKSLINEVNDIEHSDLLDDLSWTYFHHSILEHATLNFLVRGTSRGVLQEHARHRIQAISVRSTRYTMSGIINAFVASVSTQKSGKLLANNVSVREFITLTSDFDMFVTTDDVYNELQLTDIFNKLNYQLSLIGSDEFIKIAVAKSNISILKEDINIVETFKALQNGKKKRNVGDAFKHIVNDNWKVDMVVTFNLRSLKNYFTLRDSGAAYFQIRWLAQEMMKVTPQKYLDLIVKKK